MVSDIADQDDAALMKSSFRDGSGLNGFLMSGR